MGTQLNILSSKEIRHIYSLPKLTSPQRPIYLELTLPEQELVHKYRSPLTKIYFILQLCYFKFKQQFFVFDISEVREDVAYLQQAYFPEQTIPTEGTISKPARLAQQKTILTLMDYRLADQNIRRALFDRACQLAMLSASPVFIFRDLINWAEQQRIVLPGYSIMQRTIIGKALTLERKRLEVLLKKHLTEDHRAQMDYLIREKIEHYYGLTWLQQEAPNFNPQSLRRETSRKEVLQPLFQVATQLLKQLNISNENINYYASLADHYTMGELRQFKGGIHYLFILCYAQRRYQQINDVLAEAFTYYVRKYESEAKQMVREYFYTYHLDANEQLSKVPVILEMFLDDSISDNTPFTFVRQQVLDVLDKEKMVLLTNFIKENHLDETEIKWQHYEAIQRQISYNLRHLFIHLDFTISNQATHEVMKAALFLKPIFAKGKSLKKIKPALLPKGFIPRYLHSYIFTKDGFLPARYELMLYQTLSRQMEAGHIFVKDSVNHQSLEADLIPFTYWKENKAQILDQIHLEKLFLTPQALLGKLKKKLEDKIKIVNKAIISGENKEVILKKKPDGSVKWRLIYQAKEEETNHKMYQQFPVIGIVPLLNWVDEETTFIPAFRHILERGGTKQADKDSLIACLVALGTNHGVSSMAGRSDMKYNHLKRTVQSFVRLETLKEANRIIVDATADLPIFDSYNVEPETIHSSSDGQKYSTRFDTFNARYSPKYFGLGKGISLNTMVLNNVPVHAKIFGSNDHESHYVLDLIYNNPTKLRPSIHSTDTHGTNQVNFALLDIFGYQFAPRYKKFAKEIEKLVGFKKPSQYSKKYLFRPCRMINEQVIIDQWDMFQRIIASLALKTTTQSTIVRKLSSFQRVNQYHQAFIEYNDIIKSIFMLDYAHLKNFKNNIQTVLNRGEGYQRLRKNVSYAHDGKFQVHSQAEQNIWSECTRLISNAIIYYNTFLLSQLLEKYQTEGNHKKVELIKGISPIAWQHINLHGLYQFRDVQVDIDWEVVIKSIKITKRGL
jgi:TnpA family transposase